MNSTGHSLIGMEQQNSGCIADENSGVYTELHRIPVTFNSEISEEQQVIYSSAPVVYHPGNIPPSYICLQTIPNGQTVNQYQTNRLINQYQFQQQPVPLTINSTSCNVQREALHANMNQQQTLSTSACQPPLVANMLVPTSMSNPAVSSTPISATAKRGRNDTSGISDSNVQVRPQNHQTTRIFTSSNTPNKRHRGANPLRSNQVEMINGEQQQNGLEFQNHYEVTNETESVANQYQPSLAACRYATTRFPFSPFTVIFSQEVRDRLVVDGLIKHASEQFNFELKTLAYRRGRIENDQCRIHIFVENSESFSFLYETGNWPSTLAGYEFTIKRPSIPPQLALVLPAVSLQIGWEDFVQELKENYVGIADVIRLKNKARNEILEAGEISVMHLKLKVVEFYTKANVLICSNCYGIGHFKKSCPQKSESTCKTCGDKITNLKEHRCSGIAKCIHCGGPHVSKDTRCKMVKDYQAALTRNLLANLISGNKENITLKPTTATNRPTTNSNIDGASYASVVKMLPTNTNVVLLKKLDHILEKVEEESKATRYALKELKEEMYKRNEETIQQIEVLDNKVKTLESHYDDSSLRVYTIIHNICTHIINSQSTRTADWKLYWEEQIKTIEEFRKSRSKRAN